MNKETIKKATPIAVTLLIALTPQVLAFCDNRATAYETRRTAKNARLEAEVTRDKADSGYKTLLPAIEALQARQAQNRSFQLEESVRIGELTAQVEELRLMIPKRRRPEALSTLSKSHRTPESIPIKTVKLPESLDAAYLQEQHTNEMEQGP